MRKVTEQVSHPTSTIDLAQLHLTVQEMDAVRRGLTIALTSRHRRIHLGCRADERAAALRRA